MINLLIIAAYTTVFIVIGSLIMFTWLKYKDNTLNTRNYKLIKSFLAVITDPDNYEIIGLLICTALCLIGFIAFVIKFIVAILAFFGLLFAVMLTFKFLSWAVSRSFKNMNFDIEWNSDDVI